MKILYYGAFSSLTNAANKVFFPLDSLGPPYRIRLVCITAAESKEKHGVWNPMLKLTITAPYVHSRVDSYTIYHGWAGIGQPSLPESTL
jgi:hypothetical protein